MAIPSHLLSADLTAGGVTRKPKKKGRRLPGGLSISKPLGANYMWFAVVVFVVVVVVVLELPAVPDVTVLLVVLVVAGIGAFMSGAMASLLIMVPLSTTGALAVSLAALPPQAVTRRAAPAIVAMERMLRMKRSP